MKIFGYEIKKYRSKAEQIEDCKMAYEQYKHSTFYEWDMKAGEYFAAVRDIPWVVVGHSGRWLLIGSHSTYAKGCIKKVNFKAVDEVCDHSEFFCYRFIRPEKLKNTYHSIPFHQSKYHS